MLTTPQPHQLSAAAQFGVIQEYTMTTPPPLIKLQNVSKMYAIDGNNFFALRDVSLTIMPAEYTAITGPSGSGKSTLMHITGLLDRPSSGKVFIQGKDISALSDNDISKLRNQFVGFVFQQFNLINKLTVEENIVLPGIYAQKALSFNLHQRAQDLMNRFGISEKAKSYPNKLSGGQQQRVAIARALIMKPQLILADEPTGNLDTKTGNTILELLENLNRQDKVTVVLVTHEEDVAQRPRRQLRLRDGQII